MEYWQSLPGEDRGLETRRFSVEPVLIFGTELKDDDREAIDHALQIGCARFVAKLRLTEPFVSRVVCISGSTEVGEYISWLNNNASNVPIFTIPSTGGAAYDLKDRAGIANPEQGITEIIVSRRSDVHFAPPKQQTSPERGPGLRQPIDLEPERIPQFRYALYPLLVNVILDSEPGATLVAAR